MEQRQPALTVAPDFGKRMILQQPGPGPEALFSAAATPEKLLPGPAV
ncbi:MAG: hypothetical protein GX883_01000, partial [Firmicutes bacterium]|nr:hypothetical protein [Bacillota bacterium]